MRSNDYYAARFAAAAKAVMNSYFYKRHVAHQEFNEAELGIIEQIDAFLRRAFPTRAKGTFICISAKWSIKHKMKSFSVFIDRFIPTADLDYAKCDKFLAKAIYNLICDNRCEVYICVSAVGTELRDNGRYMPRRTRNAVREGHVLFADCDLPADINALSDVDLLHYLQTNAPIINEYPCDIIRTGGGVHIWFYVQQMNLNKFKEFDLFTEAEQMLIKNLKTIFSDRNAKDCVRLLRVPFSINRKSKYNRSFKIHFLRRCANGFERPTVRDVIKRLAELEAAEKDIQPIGFIDVPDDDYGAINKISGEGLKIYLPEINLEVDDGVLVKDYVNNIINDVDFSGVDIFGCNDSEAEQIPKTEVTVPSDEVSVRRVGKNRKPYIPDGLPIPDEILSRNRQKAIKMERDHRLRDICFYLLNRQYLHEPCEGIRHDLIYIIVYTLYKTCGLKDYNRILDEVLMINNLMIDPYPDGEVIKQVKSGYNKVISSNVYKGVRNDTLDSILIFRPEEKRFTFGNYALNDDDKGRAKELDKKARTNVNNVVNAPLSKHELVLRDNVITTKQILQKGIVPYLEYKRYCLSANIKPIFKSTYESYVLSYKKVLQLEPELSKVDVPKDFDDVTAMSKYVLDVLKIAPNLCMRDMLFICPYIRRRVFTYVKHYKSIF